MSVIRRLLIAGVVLNLVTQSASGAAPLIRDIVPMSACVGEKIKIVGDHLKKTVSVAFLVGHTLRHAKVLARSETELEVIVPEFYRPGAEAVILLGHTDGMAITCPTTEIVVRDNSPRIPHETAKPKVQLLHVIQGGVLPQTKLLTIIEQGGIVDYVHRSPLVVVKKGGMLVEGGRSHSDQHRALNVLYETGARLGPEFFAPNPYWSVVACREITVAEGIGPFVFLPAPVGEDLKESTIPPEITGFSPTRLHPGDILTVRGKGFAGTTEVQLLPHAGASLGFSIESDNVLKIDTPDGYMGNQHELLILNSRGLTVTRTPQLPQVGQLISPIARSPHFVTVTDGTVLTDVQMNSFFHTIFLVEPGGVITSRSAHGTFLVKGGGTIVGHPGSVYYEPTASIPTSATRAKLVPRIHVTPLSTSLQFTVPMPWK